VPITRAGRCTADRGHRYEKKIVIENGDLTFLHSSLQPSSSPTLAVTLSQTLVLMSMQDPSNTQCRYTHVCSLLTRHEAIASWLILCPPKPHSKPAVGNLCTECAILQELNGTARSAELREFAGYHYQYELTHF